MAKNAPLSELSLELTCPFSFPLVLQPSAVQRPNEQISTSLFHGELCAHRTFQAISALYDTVNGEVIKKNLLREKRNFQQKVFFTAPT